VSRRGIPAPARQVALYLRENGGYSSRNKPT
jgi:hypothetical protein